MIRCEQCKKEFKAITHKHLRKHYLTIEEYKRKFPAAILFDEEYSKNQSLKLKGKINIGNRNPAKRKSVRQKISKTVKRLWDIGVYEKRINGMIGRIGEKHHEWKTGNHTDLYLAEHNYIDFLNKFQSIDKCNRCGTEDKKINIHHVDEDRSNFLPSNLEPLCVPCHTSYHYSLQKMPFVKIGRKFSFASAHYLPLYDGPCKNLHGHEWELEISLQKRIDTRTGMVLDFSQLKKIVNIHIIDKLDHHCLNEIISNPTAENILVWCWEKLMLDANIKGLNEITLFETKNSYATLNEKSMFRLFKNKIREGKIK